jgi:hypothetical protein
MVNADAVTAYRQNISPNVIFFISSPFQFCALKSTTFLMSRSGATQ